jgi:hypothetical protein
MENVTFQIIENMDKTTIEIAIIEHPDGSFTTMPKSLYEEKYLTQLDQETD